MVAKRFIITLLVLILIGGIATVLFQLAGGAGGSASLLSWLA